MMEEEEKKKRRHSHNNKQTIMMENKTENEKSTLIATMVYKHILHRVFFFCFFYEHFVGLLRALKSVQAKQRRKKGKSPQQLNQKKNPQNFCRRGIESE